MPRAIGAPVLTMTSAGASPGLKRRTIVVGRSSACFSALSTTSPARRSMRRNDRVERRGAGREARDRDARRNVLRARGRHQLAGERSRTVRLERQLEAIDAEALRRRRRHRRTGVTGRPRRQVVARQIADRANQRHRDRRFALGNFVLHQPLADHRRAGLGIAGVDDRDHRHVADRRLVADRRRHRHARGPGDDVERGIGARGVDRGGAGREQQRADDDRWRGCRSTPRTRRAAIRHRASLRSRSDRHDDLGRCGWRDRRSPMPAAAARARRAGRRAAVRRRSATRW